MRALLLAAGLGTRLRPLTDRVPKCLVPIHDRPLLSYWLDALLRDARIDRVLINTHYLHEQVEAFVVQSRWRDRVDLVHETELLGTGGTILANRSYFGEGPLFVAHADNLTDASLGTLFDAHFAAPADVLATLLAFRTKSPTTCGILELDDARRIVGFHEKVANPPGNLASGAVYVFAPEVLKLIEARGHRFVDLSTEIMPGLLGRMIAIEHAGFFMDIGTPEALEQARRAFRAPSG
ncbi:MAG: nucleotidyltransferase family protein [Proteobacteria bacterium]|nr:nucleotidyltransferase family protein [Pseudomonadota bacterium]